MQHFCNSVFDPLKFQGFHEHSFIKHVAHVTWPRESHITSSDKMSIYYVLDCPRIYQSTTGAIQSQLKSVFNPNHFQDHLSNCSW